jgi:hypothetical protein
VVSAVKSGASSPNLIAITYLRFLQPIISQSSNLGG